MPREIKLQIGFNLDQPTIVGIEAHNTQFVAGEVIHLIEFSAFAKADEKLRRMDERYNVLRDTLLYFQEHGYDPEMARETLKKN